MIAGIRNSGCEKRVFRHNDLAHLRELAGGGRSRAAQADRVRKRLFDGRRRRADRRDLRSGRRVQRLTYCDEVHAVGMYGARGGGITERDAVATASPSSKARWARRSA
jgi:5-aminolevulinate synthase